MISKISLLRSMSRHIPNITSPFLKASLVGTETSYATKLLHMKNIKKQCQPLDISLDLSGYKSGGKQFCLGLVHDFHFQLEDSHQSKCRHFSPLSVHNPLKPRVCEALPRHPVAVTPSHTSALLHKQTIQEGAKGSFCLSDKLLLLN